MCNFNSIFITETEHPMNISISLPMAFVVEAHWAERKFRLLKLTFNKLKFIKFRFVTRRPAVSKRAKFTLEQATKTQRGEQV
jgi:hypothetical protein